MTTNGESKGGSASQEGNPNANITGDGANDQPPAWFSSYVESQKKEREASSKELDRRFEGFREKYLKKDDKSEKPEPGAAKQGLTMEDMEKHVTAAMRLGELKSKLPEDAREHVEQIAKDRGIQDAVIFAELLSKSLPAKVEGDAARVAPPKGKGASPATSQIVGPTTQTEAREMKSTPEGAAKLRTWMKEGGDVGKLPLA